MEFKQDITIKEQIDLSPLSLYLALERMKWQVERIISDSESEEGTIAREAKRLKEDIEKVEKNYSGMMYDPEKGLLLIVDRLKVKSERQDKVMIGISIGVVVAIFAAVVAYFLKK